MSETKPIYWVVTIILAIVAGVLIYWMSAGNENSNPVMRGLGSGLLVLLLLVMGAAGRRRGRNKSDRDG